MSVDWAQLPADLLVSISNNLQIYADYLRFQAVCRRWQSAVPKLPLHLPPQLPWLVLSPFGYHHPFHPTFFDLSFRKRHSLSIPGYNADTRHRGSSLGWLLIMDLSPTISLLNPISGVKLNLPPLTSFPQLKKVNSSIFGEAFVIESLSRRSISRQQIQKRFIKKIVLSSNLLKNPNFVALTIINETNELAYCRGGVDSWNVIEAAFGFSQDAIYFQGRFYAVNTNGEIAICDFSDSSPESPQVSVIKPSAESYQPSCETDGGLHYLVGAGDDLLLVIRSLKIKKIGVHKTYSRYRTKKFDVFKLNWDKPAWEEIESLGNRTLFVGGNSSFSLLASDFPGCEENCVYFTDEYTELGILNGPCKGDDIGIYRFSDRRSENLSCAVFYSHNEPPPIWLTPSPC